MQRSASDELHQVLVEARGFLSAMRTSGVCEGFGHVDEVSEKPDRRRITTPEAMAAKSSLDFR
jgi:hypothetical protein